MATSIDPISKFKKEFFNEVANEAFFIRPVFFGSLVIRHCNGMGPCPFSDATIFCEKEGNNYPVYFWWENVVEYIVKELSKIGSPEALKQQGTTIIKKFVDAITSMSSKHEKCLNLLLEDDSLTEEKIKCILALHYFKPLSDDADYCVGRSSVCKECPGCNVEIKTDQKVTTFGHNAVWYGQSDILVKRSIVKIHKDALDMLGALSIDDCDEELDLSFCSDIVEIKTEDTKKKLKSFYQAIAQTIVNAFVEYGRDNSLFDKFIPSFLATEKTIRIIMYNCKFDKLLVSDEFDIWKPDRTLNLESMMLIWVALNRYVDDSFETTKHLLRNTAESRFKEAVGEAYQFYLNGVTRPVTKVNKNNLAYANTFYQPFNKSVKDSAYIVKACTKLAQCVEDITSEQIKREQSEDI